MNFGGWSPHRAETTSLSGSTTASSTEPMERDSDKVKGQQVLNGALSPKPERAMSLANPRDLGADTAASSLHSQCSDSEGMERPTVLAESASDLDDAMRTLSNRDTGAITKRRRKKAVRTQILSAYSSDVLGKQTPIKLAIVGLPNTGKSTLLNTLLGYERVVTGPEPGLTRDAVTSSFSWGDLKFEIADTAGWVREGVLQKYDEVGGKLAGLTVLQVCITPLWAHESFGSDLTPFSVDYSYRPELCCWKVAQGLLPELPYSLNRKLRWFAVSTSGWGRTSICANLCLVSLHLSAQGAVQAAVAESAQ
jgi:hypothetical protein